MRNNRREESFDDTDDMIMNDDFDFLESDISEEQLQGKKSRGFNMDMRHRIEDRMEAKRLKEELNEYEFFDIDDEDTLH